MKNPLAASRRHYTFILTGFSGKDKEALVSKIANLGGKFEQSFSNRCTHIICSEPLRSEKYLCGCASGKWILKAEFISASSQAGRWLDETKFEWGLRDMDPHSTFKNLASAPQKWRKKVASSGRRAFEGWKVVVHVKKVMQSNRQAVYKRVFEAGGGKLYTLQKASVDLTIIIVDKALEEDVKSFKDKGVPCVLPEYIAEYLFEDKPTIDKYRVFSVPLTPSLNDRQQNVVVSTVSSKKAKPSETPNKETFRMPKVLPQSSGRRSVNSDPDLERVTPGSSTGPAEEEKLTKGETGVKRKLQFTPNQLREAINVLKKRKLSSQHLPLVPFHMALPRPKKTFQCATAEDCVAQPFHANLGNFVEAVMEESQWVEALACIRSTISTHFYPPPEVLHSIMLQVLKSHNLAICRSAIHVLKQVLCLHSPSSHPSLRKLYFQALGPQRKFDGPHYHNKHWNFFESVIRRALDGQQVSPDAREEKCEHDVRVAMETAEMLLHFLVAMMEEDFKASVRRSESGPESGINRDLAQCVLAEVLWPSSIEKSSRKVPVNAQQLMVHFMSAIKMAAKCDDWIPVTQLVASLIQLAGEVSSGLAEMTTPKNPQKGRNDARREFTECLVSQAKHYGIFESGSLQELFLSLLKPSWLCQGVAECLLRTYNDQLIRDERGMWAEKPLSMKKIVSYYFFLVPPMSKTKKDEPENKASPLKTISNQPVAKDGKTNATKRQLNINRKNAKGETPLHVACIKKDIRKVRELLTSPYINVNAQDNVGWTPLHEACAHGAVSCVQELLKFLPGRRSSSSENSKMTLDLTVTPDCGTTVLHDAVQSNYIGVVKLLLEAGGKALLSMKNSDGLTPMDLPMLDPMRKALNKLAGLNGSTGIDRKETEPESVTNSPDSQSAMPHPSHYRQLLESTETTPGAFVTEEECDKFAIITLALLQSYIRSHDLHRVKAEVEIIKGQRRLVAKLQRKGESCIDDNAPFVSVVASPTFSKASTPSIVQDDPIYLDSLLEDMEVLAELSHHMEQFKGHIRLLGRQDNETSVVATKSAVCTRVSRSMRLITHLCSIVC